MKNYCHRMWLMKTAAQQPLIRPPGDLFTFEVINTDCMENVGSSQPEWQWQSNQKLLSTSININIVHVNSILMWISQTILNSRRISLSPTLGVFVVVHSVSLNKTAFGGRVLASQVTRKLGAMERAADTPCRYIEFKKHLAIHVEQTDKQYG